MNKETGEHMSANDAFDDVNDMLLSGGVPWASFKDKGTTVTGVVQSAKSRQSRDIESGELKTWDDGSPMMEVAVIVKTELRDKTIEDDDGTRQIVINKAAMKSAIAKALRAAGAKLEVGGTLSVTYTDDAEPKKRGMNGAKQFEATYTAPALLAADDLAEAFGGEVVDEPAF
jgi:hypothetical protein